MTDEGEDLALGKGEGDAVERGHAAIGLADAVDGQRGILAWDFDLKAGTSQEISLDQTISWPGGFVLE